MSKYYSYAQEIDRDFKACRCEYLAEVDRVESAESALKRAERKGERLGIMRADLDLQEARQNLSRLNESLWPAFLDRVGELRKRLVAEIAADNAVRPEDVDAATMTLLESGICGPADMQTLLKKFANNRTMTRLLLAHMDKKANENTPTAREWRALAGLARESEADPLQVFDGLVYAAQTCCGRLRDRADPPSYVATISQKWEECTGRLLEVM